MAGGTLVVLGLTLGQNLVHRARFVGTGMHGGVIYLRGKVSQIGKEVEPRPLEESDFNRLSTAVKTFCKHFGIPFETIDGGGVMKLVPVSNRPYGRPLCLLTEVNAGKISSSQ